MLKWGIIGPGAIANSFAKEVHNAGCIVKAVYGRNENKVNKFAEEYNIEKRYTDIDEFLRDEEVEAVYIATPHSHHMEFAEKCINSKKHILCEKPFSYNYSTAEQILKKAEENELFVMEALWTLFLPAINQAKSWIEEGQIGKIKLITVNFGFKSEENKEGRLYNPSLAGGALLDVGIYPILLANYLLGEVPEKIEASGTMTSTGVDETDLINLKYKEGALASLTCSIAADTDNTAVIYGEKGKISIPFFWMAKKAILDNEKEVVFEDSYEEAGYKYEIEEAAKCIFDNKIESVSASHKVTLELAEIMDEIRRQIGLVYPFE